MYLDAAEHKYIEECGAANFLGIKDGKYIISKSPSVLPSITNMSLRQLARDMGLTVEERHIPVEELATFEECGACGTAAVISPYRVLFTICRPKLSITTERKSVKLAWNFIPVYRIFNTAELKINTVGVWLYCSFTFDDLIRAAKRRPLLFCSTWNIYCAISIYCSTWNLYRPNFISKTFTSAGETPGDSRRLPYRCWPNPREFLTGFDGQRIH